MDKEPIKGINKAMDNANNENYWLNDSLEINLSKSKIKEVIGITFKVKSLEVAKNYFMNEGLLGNMNDHVIELDSSQTFGLSINLTEL